jgi:hypothetical protein
MVALNSSNKSLTGKALGSRTLAAIALGGAVLFTAAAPANDAFAQDAATSQAVRSDAQIQADVLRQIATAPGITGQKITATTSNGVVTLTGSVTDEVTRQLAENAASGVAGVKSVQNNLTVGDLPAPDATASNGGEQQGAAPQQPAQQPANPNSSVNNGWGPAGPPPDAVNGQIPPQPAAGTQPQAAPQQGTTYGPPMGANPNYPPQGSYPQQGNAYPNSGYPSGNYPPQNGQLPARPVYRPAPPPARPYVPSGPVTIPAGTLLTVRLQNFIDARRVQAGDVFIVNAARDVFQDGVLAVPLGATLEGHVVAVKKPGAFSGEGDIQVELSQLDLDGHSYPIATDIFSTKTPGKGGYSAANTIGGAAFGAILGAAIGGGPGAAVGAVAGGAGGAAISTATPAPRSFIPAETLITFHLKSPATIQPVSPDEATRLAASMPRPVLRPRPVYYGPRPVYYGYPYPY